MESGIGKNLKTVKFQSKHSNWFSQNDEQEMETRECKKIENKQL